MELLRTSQTSQEHAPVDAFVHAVRSMLLTDNDSEIESNTLRITIVTYNCVIHPHGGDWFRHGRLEVRSRSWSPRHVKQGYRQFNWQEQHSERSGARHGCLIAPGCRTRIFPDSGKVSTEGNASRHVAGMAGKKTEPTRDENVGLRTDASLNLIAG